MAPPPSSFMWAKRNGSRREKIRSVAPFFAFGLPMRSLHGPYPKRPSLWGGSFAV